MILSKHVTENRDKGGPAWLPFTGNSQQARLGCTPLLAPVAKRAGRLGNSREGIFVPRLQVLCLKREQKLGCRPAGRVLAFMRSCVLSPVLHKLDVGCTSGIRHLGNGGGRI